jgi:hypothetical protein
MLHFSSIRDRILEFEEFCIAAISLHQMERMESCEQHARLAYKLSERNGNKPIMIERNLPLYSHHFQMENFDVIA